MTIGKYLTKPYFQLNLIFAGVLMMVFIYSGIFSASSDRYPIPSFYTNLTGKTTVSSGLSRSFSEIIRGRIESSKSYNRFGLGIFTFFLIQLLMRIFILISYQKLYKYERMVVLADSILSGILFLLFFSPFLIAAYQEII